MRDMENDDLWKGYRLSKDAWPDLERAIKVAQDQLSIGLSTQRIGDIKRAERWLHSVAEALSVKVKAAERELEEWQTGF